MKNIRFGIQTFSVTFVMIIFVYLLAKSYFSTLAHSITCSQLKAKGISNIHGGDRDYQARLDHDHDGIACEV